MISTASGLWGEVLRVHQKGCGVRAVPPAGASTVKVGAMGLRYD